MTGFNAPRGTRDILPGEIHKWQHMEAIIRQVCDLFAYGEIRTPLFEHTELFERGIGEATDIVEKEMYTFTDRGDRSVTLRPEGTAPVVRSYLEHKLYGQAQPVRLYYYGPMFRYERPQAGRYRQFHQLGVEVIGSASPMVDAECIHLAATIFQNMGLDNLEIQINSIGCPKCRPGYRDQLREAIKPNIDKLCGSCQGRYEKNPMRILDCKVQTCAQALGDLPIIGDSLCPECAQHFSQLQSYLGVLKIPHEINPRLVRGFDYYTKTVFEVVAKGIGSQDAVAGGGRYDGLVEECGGKPTPAVGFAAGLERLLLALEKTGGSFGPQKATQVYVAFLGDTSQIAMDVASKLRAQNLQVQLETEGRSLKAQLKSANRLKVAHVIIIGEEELTRGMVINRNMETGEQKEMSLEQICQSLI